MEQIKDEKQYEAAMARIEELFKEPEDNAAAMNELERLSILVSEYEDKMYPIGKGRG
jgi:antitoxin component HigA of HigAB toxin-antitoxin module